VETFRTLIEGWRTICILDSVVDWCRTFKDQTEASFPFGRAENHAQSALDLLYGKDQ
jgi:hypothetical protein